MRRWMVLLTLALCLAGGTAAADKARNIASDADSQYHAAHLENHLDTTDVYCTGNYVKVRNKINGKKVVGHLEQADQFQLLDIQKGWVKIKVTYSDKTSPDSHKGMTGWLNADYVDCYCDAGEYAGEGEANGFVYADENCRNYDEVIELYIRAIKERWDSDKISEFGFEPYCFISSLEKDGYILKDLDQDGSDELIILSRGSLESSRYQNEDMLYAVYTMKNGKPIRVLDSWTRSRNYLCADGGIYNEGSDGASYSTWCIRDIKNGRIVVREGVQTTDRMDENGEYLEGTVYLRMTESHDFYDGEEISEEQADADLARYQNMLLNDDSGFVPFAEYEKKSR